MKNSIAFILPSILSGVVQLSQAVSAASFNCGAAGLTKTEQAICGDAVLSALDAKLSPLYAMARSNATDVEKAGIVVTQKAWVGKRNQCSDTACLVIAYNERIAQLSSMTTGTVLSSGSAAAPPTLPSSTSTKGSPNAQPTPVVGTAAHADDAWTKIADKSQDVPGGGLVHGSVAVNLATFERQGDTVTVNARMVTEITGADGSRAVNTMVGGISIDCRNLYREATSLMSIDVQTADSGQPLAINHGLTNAGRAQIQLALNRPTRLEGLTSDNAWLCAHQQ